MIQDAKWIGTKEALGDICPVFQKVWNETKRIKKVELAMTALGVYSAYLNGRRISEYVLAPGWTAYEKRLQYQVYDITEWVRNENKLEVILGRGWYRSPMPGFENVQKAQRAQKEGGILGELCISYEDGTAETLRTDESWEYGESPVRFSEIYDGEHYDASFQTTVWEPAVEKAFPKEILIPQEGEEIRENVRIAPKEILHTPSGETVIDFGQEVTGYVEISLDACAGEEIWLQHGEILDQKGNFYNANYRTAKAELRYICKEGRQTWHPVCTFFGFRYVKVVHFPGTPAIENFRAVSIYSQMKRTGYLTTGNPMVNQFISNVFWSQIGNFVDVPTDCPQRDERLGWTGDAQVFVKAASYNYDIEKFFRKWLRDLTAEQRKDGGVGFVIPDYLPDDIPSAAWGDAAVICPWQIYQTYGNKEVLEEQYESMKGWLSFITNTTTTPFLWIGGEHFGDWLGLDAPAGSYKGSTREDFIASAFYAYSTKLVIKAGKVLGKDVSSYEQLYANILDAFQKAYPEYTTQTEHVLAVWFGLAENPQKTADSLAEMIRQDHVRIRTGFVGTPYILHVLSRYGYTELAYSLFLQSDYPAWMYSVKMGATTIWEHWDGIMENGKFWSTDMNSFNHYAYGSAIDWLYEESAGIHLLEEYPGFEKVRIEPKPDVRLGRMEASLDTRHGRITSKWCCQEDGVRYDISVPVSALICVNGEETEVGPGKYVFWSK